MPSAVKTGRAYSTKLRQEQAALTRRRVLEAALRLFVEHGYAEVTMQAIAREARVAYQTVYSQFGNKLALALELCASEFPHVGPTVGLLVEARERGDPAEWVGMLGGFARRLYEPCAEILRFMRQSGDRDLLERYREIESGRLQHLGDLGPQLDRAGLLRSGLSASEAVGIVWTMTSPETYERLVLDRGWSPDVFEHWLGPAIAQLVLARS